jgi:hypothetical protein
VWRRKEPTRSQNFSPRVQINCAASFAVVQKFV